MVSPDSSKKVENHFRDSEGVAGVLEGVKEAEGFEGVVSGVT